MPVPLVPEDARISPRGMNVKRRFLLQHQRFQAETCKVVRDRKTGHSTPQNHQFCTFNHAQRPLREGF